MENMKMRTIENISIEHFFPLFQLTTSEFINVKVLISSSIFPV